MKELLQAIANSSIEQQVSLLSQALDYGDLGINFLIDCLSDSELEIRAKAYELLQHNQSQKVQQEIAPGLLINPGDKIYYIQESTMWFTDSHYILSASKDFVSYLDTQDDYRSRDYKIVRFDQEVYVISYVPYYTNYQQPKSLTTSLQNERILKHSITEFDIEDDYKATEQWCDFHKLTKEVSNLQKEKDLEFNKYFELLGDNTNRFIIYWFTVEEYLKSIDNLDLLNQLWQDLVGSMVSICEVNFARKTYLTIDPYYSRILDQRNYYMHYAGEDEDEFIGNNLISEKAETRFLLSALHHSDLATRSLAYQLLKGINLDEVQQAIYQGVKLNSGDHIYSVYQAGICYTDEFLQVLWDYVDYPEQLRYQLEEYNIRDRVEQSQRIYCYTNKQKAEAKAEALHRQLIKQTKIGFEWRKENPDFDPKKWCADNNFPYKSEWDNLSDYEIVWVIKNIIWMDDELSNSFRRSRYIYHPKHIDTWFDSNQIEYDRNLDNWKNYAKLIDYLDLPENIKLLSKFWKDGTGHFAFVKEEIVLQKVYIKIGEELHNQAEASKLFAVSEEYREAVVNLLVELLENSKTKTESKSEARKILQDLDWDEIPF